MATTSLGDFVNRREQIRILRREDAPLKSESKDVISAPLRHCFAPGTFPDLDSAAVVSAVLSGSGFAKDCAGTAHAATDAERRPGFQICG